MAGSFCLARSPVRVTLLVALPPAAAERGTFTPACAERDLKAVTLIEAPGRVRQA